MYFKAWCTCRAVLLIIKPTVFWSLRRRRRSCLSSVRGREQVGIKDKCSFVVFLTHKWFVIIFLADWRFSNNDIGKVEYDRPDKYVKSRIRLVVEGSLLTSLWYVRQSSLESKWAGCRQSMVSVKVFQFVDVIDQLSLEFEILSFKVPLLHFLPSFRWIKICGNFKCCAPKKTLIDKVNLYRHCCVSYKKTFYFSAKLHWISELMVSQVFV